MFGDQFTIAVIEDFVSDAIAKTTFPDGAISYVVSVPGLYVLSMSLRSIGIKQHCAPMRPFRQTSRRCFPITARLTSDPQPWIR
jgi:hypothetical protein